MIGSIADTPPPKGAFLFWASIPTPGGVTRGRAPEKNKKQKKEK